MSNYESEKYLILVSSVMAWANTAPKEKVTTKNFNNIFLKINRKKMKKKTKLVSQKRAKKRRKNKNLNLFKKMAMKKSLRRSTFLTRRRIMP